MRFGGGLVEALLCIALVLFILWLIGVRLTVS